ncbi:hypothetical protein BZG36_04069 [Bifiguratus adelaidae]|uniref:C2H2-type domain-containing protein n=1 Tax=Bifiguratus adelaidae TaxID=1938954 RepID=A0A261XXX2_9FUNG|nr:hypothetical protein BZG36_04069 [Bifiguratus adelaidae]
MVFVEVEPHYSRPHAKSAQAKTEPVPLPPTPLDTPSTPALDKDQDQVATPTWPSLFASEGIPFSPESPHTPLSFADLISDDPNLFADDSTMANITVADTEPGVPGFEGNMIMAQNAQPIYSTEDSTAGPEDSAQSKNWALPSKDTDEFNHPFDADFGYGVPLKYLPRDVALRILREQSGGMDYSNLLWAGNNIMGSMAYPYLDLQYAPVRQHPYNTNPHLSIQPSSVTFSPSITQEVEKQTLEARQHTHDALQSIANASQHEPVCLDQSFAVLDTPADSSESFSVSNKRQRPENDDDDDDDDDSFTSASLSSSSDSAQSLYNSRRSRTSPQPSSRATSEYEESLDGSSLDDVNDNFNEDQEEGDISDYEETSRNVKRRRVTRSTATAPTPQGTSTRRQTVSKARKPRVPPKHASESVTVPETSHKGEWTIRFFPYLCQTCMLPYQTEAEMDYHTRAAHGNMNNPVCRWIDPETGVQCHSKFSRPADLVRHAAVHKWKHEKGRIVLFSCDICGKAFSRHDAVLRHQSSAKNHH